MSSASSPGTRYAVRVRYAETDQMGFAHHANYLIWFESARVQLCDEIGLPYRELESLGYALPVVDVHCRYRSPSRFDDLLTIQCTVIAATRKTLRIAYIVTRSDTVLAEAEISHVVMGPDGKSKSLPPEILAKFAGLDS